LTSGTGTGVNTREDLVITEGKPELLLDTSLQMSLHLSEEEIREAVRRLTKEISRDYAGTRPSHRPQFFQEIG